MKAIAKTTLCAICALTTVLGAAATRGTTAAGAPYVSGGVGEGEQNRLSSQSTRFNLHIVTALRGSGQYLAGVRVQIFDAKGRSVFDERLDGPWLLIGLPAGRYVVAAQHGENMQRRATALRTEGRREVVFYFEGQADWAEIHPCQERSSAPATQLRGTAAPG